MDFTGWNDVKAFYKHFIMKEPINEVYFIMDRDDDNKLIGFVEYYTTGGSNFKEFIGYLHFTLGFHFFPCKKVLVQELEEIKGFDDKVYYPSKIRILKEKLVEKYKDSEGFKFRNQKVITQTINSDDVIPSDDASLL